MNNLFIYIVIGYLVLVNLWAFVQMGLDKRKAKKQQWRIPEKVLFLPVILGGGIGGIIGMNTFRHKTKHWYFKYGFPLITVLEIGIGIYIAIRIFA